MRQKRLVRVINHPLVPHSEMPPELNLRVGMERGLVEKPDSLREESKFKPRDDQRRNTGNEMKVPSVLFLS